MAWKRRLAVLTLAFLPPALVFAVAVRAETAPQPIRFSHKVHYTDNRIDCRFCHSAANKSQYANLPSVQKCMACHRSVAAGNPEVMKIAKYWKEKKPIPWNRVTELPDFVYFPHFRMVTYGKIPCLTCHPGTDRVAAAEQRQEFAMGWCLQCHRSRGVSIDCWTCHI